MSLQLAAQHMASRGRGPDTQLVHMAPQEVAGLHALARAHGGSLTLNPDTGLPEAGFLSKLLPTLIGAGLSVASGGALTPLMAAGITGAGYGLATGSLSKGLMAGMGAFGGAGLAGGVMGAGANAGLAGLDAGMGAYPSTGTIGAEALSAGANTAAPAFTTPVSEYATPLVGTPDPVGLAAPAPAAPIPAAPPTAQLTAGVPQVSTATPMADRFSQFGQGFQNLGTDQGQTAFMDKIGGGGGLFKYGMYAGLPLLMQDERSAQAPKSETNPYNYTFDYGRVANPETGYTGAYTGQRTYFNPRFTRTAAGGGLMDLGPVQAMSDQNAAQMMMANGGQMYAEGGATKAVKPVEQDPYYTMSGQSGDAYKYLMGQMPAAQAPASAPAASVAAAPAGLAAASAAPVSGSSNATMRPYTFDPVTGAFTAMPVVEPAPVSSGGDGFYYNTGNVDTVGIANGGITALAQGGPSHLGDYSDGGRLLKGPGDGVSDSIPATIADKRPARLADGEFVVPARIVSELGNGSTEAGARKLYAMMDRVQKARAKTVGKDRVAVNSRAEKMMPA